MTFAAIRGSIYVSPVCLGQAGAGPVDWGSISTEPVDGSCEVVLENLQMRAVYRRSPNPWAGRHPTCMVEYHYKKIGKERIENGRWDDILDPLDHSKKPPRPKHYYREHLLSAKVIYDGPDRKTVHLKWENTEEEVSIFPKSPIIQIDYIRWYVLITDWPDWPKGRDAIDRNFDFRQSTRKNP